MDKILNEKNILRSFGYIGIIADLVTIYIFVEGMKFEEFWTKQWIISIVLIIFLFIVALLFFQKANDNSDETTWIMTIFGVGYTLCGGLLFFYFSFKEIIEGDIDILSYYGYWALFGVMYAISLLSVIRLGFRYLILQSYLYGAAILYLMFLLIYKYTYKSEDIEIYPLLREVIILIVDSIIFFITHSVASKR